MSEERRLQEVPAWLVDSRALIIDMLDEAAAQLGSGPKPLWSTRDYAAGYYDACRHALKALPPYVKFPDAEAWRSEGFAAPESEALGNRCPTCNSHRRDTPVTVRIGGQMVECPDDFHPSKDQPTNPTESIVSKESTVRRRTRP